MHDLSTVDGAIAHMRRQGMSEAQMLRNLGLRSLPANWRFIDALRSGKGAEFMPGPLTRNEATVRDIVLTAARVTGHKPEFLYTCTSKDNRDGARFLVAHIVWEFFPELNFVQLGNLLDGRHHSSVQHAIKVIPWRLEREPKLREWRTKILEALK